MENKKDIFDRIMALPVLNIFEPFYKKYKEVILYLFFGGLAFVVSIVTYAFFNVFCEMNELIANFISWIITVTFAYFTNRIWVFESSVNTTKKFVIEMISFFEGRLVTLVIEEAILFVFITLLTFNSLFIKVIAQVVVIILNYIISKLWIFNKKL